MTHIRFIHECWVNCVKYPKGKVVAVSALPPNIVVDFVREKFAEYCPAPVAASAVPGSTPNTPAAGEGITLDPLLAPPA